MPGPDIACGLLPAYEPATCFPVLRYGISRYSPGPWFQDVSINGLAPWLSPLQYAAMVAAGMALQVHDTQVHRHVLQHCRAP
eukprot:2460269-Rhodomonas_salina.1